MAALTDANFPATADTISVFVMPSCNLTVLMRSAPAKRRHLGNDGQQTTRAEGCVAYSLAVGLVYCPQCTLLVLLTKTNEYSISFRPTSFTFLADGSISSSALRLFWLLAFLAVEPRLGDVAPSLSNASL